MRRTRSPALVVIAVAVVATAPAKAQTVTNPVPQVTTTVPEVTTTVPEVAVPPAAPSTPSTPTAPSTPSAPSGEDVPQAPEVGGTVAESKQKDLSRTGIDAPARPGERAPSTSSNGGGSGGGGSSTGPGSPAGGGGGSSRESSTSAPAERSGGRGRERGRTPGGPDRAATDAGWLDLALDPRSERLFTRRLRETVSELERCLYLIGPRERRILSLRAGLGGGAQRSRAAVARRLDLTRAGVATTEQGALRSLLDAARSGACGQDAVTVAGAFASAGTLGGIGDGWPIDRLRFGSTAPSAGGGIAAPAASGLGPALLDAEPFSRVAVAGPASSAEPGGRVPWIGSWLEAGLAALLLALLALLAWLVATRARRAFREPRAPQA